MTEPRKKLTAEELLQELLKEGGDGDDAAEIAALPPDQLALELKAGGYEPEKLRERGAREMEMIRAALADIEGEQPKGDARPEKSTPGAESVVVPLRRRRLTWSLLAAAAIAASLAAIPAIEMIAQNQRDQADASNLTANPAPDDAGTDH
jgi:hypothetical protein